QIVANPYVIALGDESTGSHRVSLAGGINSFGTAIGPLLLAFAIFGSVKGGDDAMLNSSVVNEKIVLKTERSSNKTETISGPVFLHERTVMGKLPYFYFANHADTVILKDQYSFMNEKKKGCVIIYNERSTLTDSLVKFLKKNFPDSRVPVLTVNTD